MGTSYKVATPSSIAAVVVSTQCPPARVSRPLVLCPHGDDCMHGSCSGTVIPVACVS